MCPFCYIGKRKFEQALADFEHRDQVEIVWKSFQLNPGLSYQPNKDLYDHVAELKGQTRDWSVQINKGVVESAKSLGLDYRFDKAKITNSFDAHRVIQFAKTQGLGEAIEERFFRAYFTEGALMSDFDTLTSLAADVGLERGDVRNVLENGKYADEVRMEGEEARHIGATGVPFFVMNRKYSLSGAQNPELFKELLNKSYAESINNNI